jgi:polysaccharide biosynthesis protein PslH
MVLAPFPPRLDGAHGGSRAIAQLHVRLAAVHPLALVYLRTPDEPPIDEALRRRCALVREVMLTSAATGYPRRVVQAVRTGAALLRRTPTWVTWTGSPTFAAAVRAIAEEWRPDIVQIEFHVMGQYLDALDASPARTVLRQHEVGAAAARDRIRQERGAARVLRVLDWAAWRSYERTLARRVDVTVAFTERDAALMHGLVPEATVARIPLGVELSDRPTDPAGVRRAGLLFVGNFVHPPNVAAATRLADRILPRIRQTLPDTMLTLVGPRPPAALRSREGEGITVTGEVPDVRPFLDAAAVVVAPLEHGGGMRVKVVEALAAGVALVASPLAVEGLAVTSGDQLIVAETDEQTAAACVMLLADPDGRAALAARASAWAARHLGWAGPVAAFEELYASLVR